MSSTTCPQTSSEHVLPRNLLTGGLCKISHFCSTAYKLGNNSPYNWKWVPLPVHKPRLNMFCPEISFLGACVKLVTYVLLLTNLWATEPGIGDVCHYRPTRPIRNLLTRACKISHLCATAYKLVRVSTVGCHVLELEDKIDACLSEHKWCGDGLRIGRILFARSDYPLTDCSLGRAR